MERYLATLDEAQTQRSQEEYLGAFTESMKIILRQNPIERLGHAVLLAAKTALRMKAALPELKEHEIANRLQAIARNIRLVDILADLTPEEKRILQLHPHNHAGQRSTAATVSRRPAKPSRAKTNGRAHTRRRG